jgi:hypothetical protein
MVQLVIGVLTLLLGGVVSAIIGHALKAQKDRVEFLRTKLEALSLASGQLRRHSEEWSNMWHRVIGGSMPLERANVLQDSKAKEAGDSFDTAASLIRVHFPALQPELEKCQTQLSLFTHAVHLFRKTVEKEGKLSDDDHKLYIRVMMDLQNSTNDLVRAIAVYGEQIGLISKATERSAFDRH